MIAAHLRRHAGFAAFVALLAPLLVAFCWHSVLASLGDDAMSYITVARHLSPFSTDALIEPWVRYYSHFPPLFPLVLALTGGAWNLFVGHMVMAACALLAAVMVYAYGSSRLGSPRAGLVLAIVFMMTPTAWVSLTDILSEPLYLALSLAVLVWHDKHEERDDASSVIVLSLLIAATYMTRVAGVALLAAYAVHIALRAISRRRWPSIRSLVPLALAVACQLAWIALRPPLESRGYQTDLLGILGHWLADPVGGAMASWQSLSGAWISSFTADSEEPLYRQLLFGAIAALAFVGTVRGAMRNRLDAWYILASWSMLFLWVFSEDNQRRLMYPLVPLMLAQAGEVLRDFVNATRPRFLRLATITAIAFVLALCAPAMILIFQKSFDRDLTFPEFAYTAASQTDYYTTVNRQRARGIAWRSAAVLAGLEAIDRDTPPGSRVMWMRPEYVAVLGKREAVPWYYRWDRATLAREIQRTDTSYVIAAALFKTDLENGYGDAFAMLYLQTPHYLHPVRAIPGPEPGIPEFVIYEVDRKELSQVVAEKR